MDKLKQLERLAKQISACERCGLHKTRTNAVLGRGHFDPTVLFIGEFGAEVEDTEGLAFVGDSGEMLNNWIIYLDLLDDEFAVDNIGHCAVPMRGPNRSREPKQEEIEACRPWLEQTIEILEPEIFVCVGRYATAWFLGKEYMKGITQYGGKFINDIYYPIPHPSYFLRNGARNKPEIWQPYLDNLKIYIEENFD